ncbi:MAG: hypothetical protein JKY55_01725 [Aliivibrio sp.]|uniref:hypothetical protein n=1 Tax=Aliivibrio sp. TaxID=1872443 RepID=UPI001A364EF4|nr:hypothetical protein [Aliivibrio sp.]
MQYIFVTSVEQLPIVLSKFRIQCFKVTAPLLVTVCLLTFYYQTSLIFPLAAFFLSLYYYLTTSLKIKNLPQFHHSYMLIIDMKLHTLRIIEEVFDKTVSFDKVISVNTSSNHAVSLELTHNNSLCLEGYQNQEELAVIIEGLFNSRTTKSTKKERGQ